MKKTIICCFAIMSIFQSFIALAEDHKDFMLGLMIGTRYMEDDTFPQLYGKSILFIGGTFGYVFPLKGRNHLEIALAFKKHSATGKTSYTREEIRFHLISLVFSPNYLINFSKFTASFGPGLAYIHYNEKYPKTYPLASNDGSAIGINIQVSLRYHLFSSLSAQTNLTYCLSKVTKQDLSVNLGGMEWGFGLLCRFSP